MLDLVFSTSSQEIGLGNVSEMTYFVLRLFALTKIKP